MPGGNLWEYHYHVSGFAGQTGWGFDIFFPQSEGYRKDDLEQTPTPPSGDWSVTTFQPDLLFDPAKPQDGFYDAVANVDVPSTLATFNVSFNWRGTGKPGSQYFEVFDSNYIVQETGNTIQFSVENNGQSLPEPASLWLIIGAVPWLVRFKGKK